MRKKLKRKIAIPQVEQTRDVLPDNLSREEMTQIIADAIVLAEEEKMQKGKATGAGVVAVAKKGSIPWINRQPFQMIVLLCDFLLSPHKIIKGEGFVLEFLKIILQVTFFTMEIIGVIAGVVMLKSAISLHQELYICFADLLFAEFTFIFVVLFHLIRAEVENSNDKNYLLNIAVFIGTIASAVIALISLKNGGL